MDSSMQPGDRCPKCKVKWTMQLAHKTKFGYVLKCSMCNHTHEESDSAEQAIPKFITHGIDEQIATNTSDGSSADYYKLPVYPMPTQLQDLISHKDMNAQIGEIFRACYRYGEVSHSDMMRDAKKIVFYAQAEVARLEQLEEKRAEEKQQLTKDLDEIRGMSRERFSELRRFPDMARSQWEKDYMKSMENHLTNRLGEKNSD